MKSKKNWNELIQKKKKRRSGVKDFAEARQVESQLP